MWACVRVAVLRRSFSIICVGEGREMQRGNEMGLVAVISILGVDTPMFQKSLPRPFISYRTDNKSCTRAPEVVTGRSWVNRLSKVRKWNRI